MCCCSFFDAGLFLMVPRFLVTKIKWKTYCRACCWPVVVIIILPLSINSYMQYTISIIIYQRPICFVCFSSVIFFPYKKWEREITRKKMRLKNIAASKLFSFVSFPFSLSLSLSVCVSLLWFVRFSQNSHTNREIALEAAMFCHIRCHLYIHLPFVRSLTLCLCLSFPLFWLSYCELFHLPKLNSIRFMRTRMQHFFFPRTFIFFSFIDRVARFQL